MTTETLQQLLQLPEGAEIGFRRDLNDRVPEIITAIFDLANKSAGTAQEAYLVIGAEDGRLYDVADAGTEHLEHLLTTLKSTCAPAFPDVGWERVAIENTRLLVLTIPPVPQKIECHISGDKNVHLEKVRDISGVVTTGDVTQNIIHIHMAAAEDEAKKRFKDIGMLYNFDLGPLVETCVETLYMKKGLVGFAIIPCESESLLMNFCERLQSEWGRNRVTVKERVSLKATHTSLEYALTRITEQYKEILKTRDVLFPVEVFSEKQLIPFWQSLHKECAGLIENRMIAVLDVCADVEKCQDIVKLQPPQFKIPDLYRWVREICERAGWQKDCIDKCVEIIREKSAQNGTLHPEMVYICLEHMLELLKPEKKLRSEDFLLELERRCK